jgi:hypothetical protein
LGQLTQGPEIQTVKGIMGKLIYVRKDGSLFMKGNGGQAILRGAKERRQDQRDADGILECGEDQWPA